MTDENTYLLTGGALIDGSGSRAIRMDVAINGGRIAGISSPGTASASTVVDATGGVVCPGFIDIHTHSDLSLLGCPQSESKIRQGVTTEVVGNCGGSAAPLLGAAIADVKNMASSYGVDVDWVSFDEYLQRLSDVGTSVNVASLVGADTIRMGVLGLDDVEPDAEELERMKTMVSEAMAQGAYGLSSGLIYAPGCYASTEELIALAEAIAPFAGIYASHIRGEGSTLLKAVDEAIRIGREAAVRVQISHHKAIGPRNWGLVSESLKAIEDARRSGIDVAFDVYPYTASCTSLHAILPPWVQDGGRKAILENISKEDVRQRIKDEFKDLLNTLWENTVAEDGWDNIAVSGFKKAENKRLEHMRMNQIAELRGIEPADAAMDLLIEEGFDLMGVFHEISDDDVSRVISHPLASVASDGEVSASVGPCSGTAVHPRAFGTFPRAIREYSLRKGLIPLEEMIRKMTSAPAERMGFADRGRLAEGMMADIVVFDRERIRDMATFENPNQYAEGITHVFVNGVLTICDGEHTGELAGIVLKKNASVS
ncbi:MAG: D-aminoacylase [Thermoplasmata archaeon]|nr:D-aminoacylase [Thermoplasmata archaeon]